MRRIISADKVSVGIAYFVDNTEVGHLHYNLQEGKFTVQCLPEPMSVFTRIGEYLRVLRFAGNIVKSEYV